MRVPVQVAVGCLVKNKYVLIGQRLASQSFSGDWEFPGGKLEANETPEIALVREFLEETGLETDCWRPLINYSWTHQLPKGPIEVHLHVFITDTSSGEITAPEGHTFEWVAIDSLDQYQMLIANKGIVRALQLPNHYVLVPECVIDPQRVLSGLDAALAHDKKLIVFSAQQGQGSKAEFVSLANELIRRCHVCGAKLIVNTPLDWFNAIPLADGLQIVATELHEHAVRPISREKLLGVVLHHPLDLDKALQVDADFILASLAQLAESNRVLDPNGWIQLRKLIASSPIPVFAVGGEHFADDEYAIGCGVQGVARTYGFWPKVV